MELLSAESILSRIVAARESLPSAVAIAFDGDGTLWSGDVGDAFFHAAVAAARFSPQAVAAMNEVGRTFGVSTAGLEAPQLADGLFAAYLDHRVPEDTICEVIAWMCAGWTEAEVYTLARSVVAREGLPARLHTELDGILAWARGEGIETLLVSASPRPIVEVAGALRGFMPSSVLATTAPFADGVMLPEVVRPIPYGSGKAALLEDKLRDRDGKPRPLLAAFGDNVFDIPMLQAARVAVAVDPKPRLLAQVASLPGLVRLEMRSRKGA